MESKQKVFTCPICGAEMDGFHCKITCPVCGYREDCSDAGLIIYEEDQVTPDTSQSQEAEKRSGTIDQERPVKR